MIYAKTDDNGVVIEYPVYERHIKNRGHRFDMYEPVEVTPQPNIDEMRQYAAKRPPTRHSDGRLYERWAVMDKPVSDARDSMLIQLNDAYSDVMANIISQYPEAEMITWDRQDQEAAAYTHDPDNAQTPFLSKLAQTRGMPLSELVPRVIAKSAAWIEMSGAATGARQRVEDQINAAETVDALRNINPVDAFKTAYENARNVA